MKFLILLLSPLFLFAHEGDIDWKGAEPTTISDYRLKPSRTIYKNLRSGNIGASFFIEKNQKINLIPSIEIYLEDQKITITANNEGQALEFCKRRPNGLVKGTFKLKNKYFNIKQRKTYQVPVNLECGRMTSFIFNHDQFSGQALGIYDVAMTAVKKFKKLAILDFWRKKIDIVFPGRGDYYSWGTINITKGHFWDVVGHELGHALYDQAKIGRLEGGSHKIDKCYSKGLALSEGWASFFSAWLKVKLDDQDAKFEFMVARRAPIEFENIPSDVCPGENNEWRVTGFLWDLIDTHEDLEDSAKMPFKDFWKFTLNKNFRKTSDIAKGLIKNDFDPLLMQIIWKQNFLKDLI